MKKKSNSSFVFEKILPEGIKTEKFIVYFSLSLLFIIAVTYFYLFGDGIFFYQENNSLFIFSSDYFQQFAAKPGGIILYAGYFITQFYFNSLYGSLILSTLLIVLCIVFIKIYKRLQVNGTFFLLFILLPSFFLLLLQTRFNFFVQHSLGYLLVLLWFLLTIGSKKPAFRFIFLGLFPLFYYLVGSFALIFLGLYIVYSLIYEKGFIMYYFLAFMLGIALLTFFVFKELLFLQPANHLLGYPLFFSDISRQSIDSYLFDGFIVLFPLIIYAAGLIKINSKFKRVIPSITMLTAFPVTIFILFVNYDTVFANLMQFEKLVYMQEWESVIKQHERSPSKNIIGQYYYNLALTETDQLCDRLFCGSQNFGPMSLILPRNKEHTFRALYYYYAIGMIGEAHHLAYELMVGYGYRPENIKMLIKTELINGNYRAAKRYINVFKKTLHYNKWAENYEKMLFNPSLINSDPELREKIKLLPNSDFFVVRDEAMNLELLLKAKPNNKRAFEYKIAILLLKKDLPGVSSEVKKMKEIGYVSIPRHIEEAILAFMYFNKESPDLAGLSIRPETQKHFDHYMNVYNDYNGEKALLDKVMKSAEKNTFWYYLQFDQK